MLVSGSPGRRGAERLTSPRTSARPEPAEVAPIQPRVEPLSGRWSHAFLACGAVDVLATSLSQGALRGWLLVGSAVAALGATAVVAQRRQDLLGPVSILRVARLLLVPGYVILFPLGLNPDLALGPILNTAVLLVGGSLLSAQAQPR